MDATLLLLVDGRFPAGGHAYSAGVEAAVAVGDVIDTPSLERYLHGRLATSGVVDAAFAAHACARLGSTVTAADAAAIVTGLDEEYAARVLSPYLRDTSRRLGRQLLRAVARIWSTAGIDALGATSGGAHQPIVLGAAVAAAGGTPGDAVVVSCHHLTAAVTSAAVRLLGLDPIELAVVQARVGRSADAWRMDADRWARSSPAELPAVGGTLTEILGERHGALDARMFIA